MTHCSKATDIPKIRLRRLRPALSIAFVATAVAVTIGSAEALASNASVTKERTTWRLFAEYPGEFRWAYPWARLCQRDPLTRAYEVHCRLEWREAYAPSAPDEYGPVHVEVECERNRCASYLNAPELTEGPVEGTFGPTTEVVVIVDRTEFRGRKGTYHESGWRE
jgi:hypothetical protein